MRIIRYIYYLRKHHFENSGCPPESLFGYLRRCPESVLLPLLLWCPDLGVRDESLVSFASGGGGGWHSAPGGAGLEASGGGPPELGLRVRRWAILPPLTSGCCRRFLALPPEVFRRLLMVPTAVNFQWCQILRGGFAEFFAFWLRTFANLQMLVGLISPPTSGVSGGTPPEPPQF